MILFAILQDEIMAKKEKFNTIKEIQAEMQAVITHYIWKFHRIHCNMRKAEIIL